MLVWKNFVFTAHKINPYYIRKVTFNVCNSWLLQNKQRSSSLIFFFISVHDCSKMLSQFQGTASNKHFKTLQFAQIPLRKPAPQFEGALKNSFYALAKQNSE